MSPSHWSDEWVQTALSLGSLRVILLVLVGSQPGVGMWHVVVPSPEMTAVDRHVHSGILELGRSLCGTMWNLGLHPWPVCISEPGLGRVSQSLHVICRRLG